MERCADDVEAYLKMSAQHDFARRATLFYKANVNYLASAERELIRAQPEDLLGFVPRSARDRRIGRSIVEPIVASDHDLQVHIHHEYYTYNDTPRDADTYAYLQTPRGRSFDDARLELAIRLGLDTLREDGGFEPKHWFFVHGHWALNGSDPHECNVVREIEILKRNGCLGDFTQPAGRTHVDSRVSVPYLVDPAPLPKGYDTPEARPTAAAGAGAGAADRFFIWASESTHKTCSIDTYSPIVQQRLKEPEAAALDHARSGVVVDGVLYVKTHCHSLHPAYCNPDGLPTPHSDPAVQAELAALFKAADRAKINVEFLTASEVYDKVIGAPATAPHDLVKTYGLARESQMAPIGCMVEFVDAAGAVVTAPPLGVRPEHLPEPSLLPSPVAPGGADVASVAPVAVARIVPVPAVAPGSVADLEGATPWSSSPLMDASARSPELMAAADVARVNERACALALARSDSLGAEASGVTGFYGPRAQQGQLLQAPEVLCAAFVQTRLRGVHTVFEIGCGLGLLSCLLSLRGHNVVGVERNGARLATARAIGESVCEARQTPHWVKGVFPKTVRNTPELATSVALVTNLLGSATDEQQKEFIEGLRSFGAVVIDAQRFYDRRTTAAQFNDLTTRFEAAGFDRPRLAFDLGPDGQFLLFTNPRPRRRLGVAAVLARLGVTRDEPLFTDA